MKKNLKPNSPLAYWDSAFIVGALLLVVFVLRRVWPFGPENVSYSDMAQGTLPVICHVYDWLHGEKALLFDWYSGLGVSMAASYTVTPFDLLLYLFKREHLLYALGVMVWVKSVAAAFTARLSFERMFPKAPELWKLLFSVSYALSSYAMTYYTNISWLDFVILFPLLLWGLKRLLDENKPILYTVCYAIALYLSFYQGYMVTLAVFFLGGLYLLTAVQKEDRPQRTAVLGAATLTGALISCFHSVPFAVLSLSSQRFNNNIDKAGDENMLLHILKKAFSPETNDKLFLLTGLEIAAAFALLFLLRSLRAKKIRQALFVGGGLIIMFSQLLCENVNLFWHGGDYVQFPMRFFYSSAFFVFCLALAYLERFGETLRPFHSKALKAADLVIILLVSAAFLYTLFTTRLLFTIVAGFGVALLATQQSKKITRVLFTVLILSESFLIAFNGIANTARKADSQLIYQSESYVNYCAEASELDLSTSALGRVKNPDTSLNTNYPFLTRTQALSNWTHFIPPYLQRTSSALGYSGQYTRLLDSGGTVFTDALLGMEKAVARNSFRMAGGYTLLEQGRNFSVYQNDYAVPLGLTTGEGLLQDLTADKNADEIVRARFDTQNELYRLFTQTDEDLIRYADTANRTAEGITLTADTDKQVVFTCTAGKNEVFYLNVCGFKGSQRTTVQVNGKDIEAPYYKQVNYMFYPSGAVNGLLELGTFEEGETVTVTVTRSSRYDLSEKNIQLGCLSLDKLAALKQNMASLTELTRSKTGLSFDYSNTGEKRYVFIPVSYDSGWKAAVNGQKAEVKQALGAYLAVELPGGSGHVALKHTTPAKGIGSLLSLVGLVGFALLMLWRKRDYRINRKAAMVVFVAFLIAFTGAVLVVYGASFVMFAKIMLPIVWQHLSRLF